MRWCTIRIYAFAAGLASSMAAAGCGPSTCDRSPGSNPPITYTDGALVDGVYMSSAWDGDDDGDGEVEPEEGLLYFPGGMRYDIRHKLGRMPRSVQIYLSFDRDGTKTGTLAQAAGNQAEVRCVDEETLILVNGSCSEYWLLVVASAGEESSAGGEPAPDAGTPGRCREELAKP